MKIAKNGTYTEWTLGNRIISLIIIYKWILISVQKKNISNQKYECKMWANLCIRICVFIDF